MSDKKSKKNTPKNKASIPAVKVAVNGGGKTLLDDIINFQIIDNQAIQPVERTKNIVYLCKVKTASTSEKFLEITDKSSITTYTDDTLAGALFDYGMNKIILAFSDNSPDFSELAKYAYTLIFGAGVDTTTDVSGFDGVVVYSTPTMSSDFDTLAATVKRAVVLSKADEALACAIFANFVLQNTLTDMQYANFGNFTPVITAIGDIDTARDSGYTFIANDPTTITSPSLIYFRAGNLPIKNIYITENLKQDIQVACYDLITNNSLSYDNIEIGDLITTGEKIIENYVTVGLIRSADFTIPARELQTDENIIAGMLANVKTSAQLIASIWRMSGTIETSY